MKKILVIIDLQYDFTNDETVVVKNIREIIKKAYNKRYRILNISLNDEFGKSTIKAIKSVLEKIPKTWHISKKIPDGTKEVHQSLLMMDANTSNCELEICGMNTDECVYETVKGLNKIGYSVSVHKDGTDSKNLNGHISGIKKIQALGIKII